jgi:nitrite reductase/ring-hydroxylating ferredoxin subunit
MNPARPQPGAFLANLDALPDPGAITFDFVAGDKRFSLILARRGNEVRCFENSCPHADYPLERPDGRVVMQAARFLVCSAHGASFEFDDGACAGGPCDDQGLTQISIEIRDGAVFMRRPD